MGQATFSGRKKPIVAMLALFVALTGTAVATTSALITGANIKNGSITGADVKNKSLTSADVKGQLRGPRGLSGAPGAQGAKGDKGGKGDKEDKGDQGPGARWALINANGTIAEQSGGISVTSSAGNGGYWINFGSDISRKMVHVSIRAFEGYAQALQCAGPTGVGCSPGGDTSHVFVYTHNADGTPVDHAFYVAVVGPDGIGTGATALTPVGANPASAG
jgi:hypothetical protein